MYKLTILILFSLFILRAFSDTHVIYVDLSSTTSSIKLTSEKINEMCQGISYNDNFLLYISNGGRPLISYSLDEVSDVLKDLTYIPTPPRPSSFNDIDSLNALLSSSQMLTNINQLTRKLSNKTYMHFFLNPQDSQIDELVKKFILSNRLATSNGILDNCAVKIYFDCSESNKECNELKKTYNNKYDDYEILLY